MVRFSCSFFITLGIFAAPLVFYHLSKFIQILFGTLLWLTWQLWCAAHLRTRPQDLLPVWLPSTARYLAIYLYRWLANFLLPSEILSATKQPQTFSGNFLWCFYILLIFLCVLLKKSWTHWDHSKIEFLSVIFMVLKAEKACQDYLFIFRLKRSNSSGVRP